MSNLTDAQLERLATLDEEMHEAGKLIAKIIRFGYGNSHPTDPTIKNDEALARELGHVIHAAALMASQGDISDEAMWSSAKEKADTIIPYLKHQELKESNRSEVNRCKYCKVEIPLGQIWCPKCATK